MKKFVTVLAGMAILSSGVANASPYSYEGTIGTGSDKWYSAYAGQTFTGMFDITSPTKMFTFSSALVSYDSATDAFTYSTHTTGYNFQFTNSKMSPYYADFFLQDSNDDGVIEKITVTDWVGSGDDAYQQGFSKTITPSAVPIPGAVWLLGSGLAGLVGLRRKKVIAA